MTFVSCIGCGKEFRSKPSWIKRGYGKYCSRKCQHKAARKGRTVHCHTCGSPVYRKPKDLERSKSGKFFCNKKCQTQWRNQLYTGPKHRNFTNGKSTYRAALSRSGAPKRCGRCSSNDVRVLAVHHIDKDRTNNKIENLAWLCHNCHYLIHHYKDEYVQFMAAIV